MFNNFFVDRNDPEAEFLTFKTVSKWEFIFGMIQKMKLNFFACFDENSKNKSTKEINLEDSMLDMQSSIYGTKKPVKEEEKKEETKQEEKEEEEEEIDDLQAQLYNSTTDLIDLNMYDESDDEELGEEKVDDSDELNFEDLIFPTEIGSVVRKIFKLNLLFKKEFTIGEILMNLEGSVVPDSKDEILKNATRSKEFKIHFPNKPKYFGKSICKVTLALPNPEEHMIPRIINEDLTHYKIEKLDHFTDVEYQTMSVS